mmetsp:Transcript_85350/g.238220  ORF Transcript_85350/g.238220 Transcript_85350/m.238220 type:complete len:572 (-) Transcript_85350:18-1733(-)
MAHVALTKQGDRCLEGGEVAEFGHVDAVNVGEADLWATRHDHDVRGTHAIERSQDGVLEGVATDNGIVKGDDGVLPSADSAVVDVVGVHREVLAGGVFLDERPDLRVLVDHLLDTHLLSESLHRLPAELVSEGGAALHEFFQSSDLLPIQIILRLLRQPVEGKLGRVRNERENGILQGAPMFIKHFQKGLQQQPAELFALAVNLGVVRPGEVNALERALLKGQWGQDPLEGPIATPLDEHRLSWRDGVHTLLADFENRLYQRCLACHRDDVLVRVIEGGPNAAGVAEHKGISMAEEPRDAVSAIPVARRPTEDPRHVQILGDEAEARLRVVPGGRILDEEIVVFLVHEVPDFLEQHDRVGKLTRVLSDLDKRAKQVLVVRDIEVPCEDEIPRHPIALPGDGMATVNAVLTVGAVPNVREKGLATKRHMLPHPLRIGFAGLHPGGFGRLLHAVTRILLHPLEKVLDGVRCDGFLAVDVLRAWRHVHGHAGDACAILASVPLLFHKHVHAVESEELRPILLKVILRRLQEPQEGEAAFVANVLRHFPALVNGALEIRCGGRRERGTALESAVS